MAERQNVDARGLYNKIQGGNFTQEEFHQISRQMIAPGTTVADLIKTSFEFEEIRLTEDGKIVPDLSRSVKDIRLNPEEQDALLAQLQESGKSPVNIIREYIRKGLGLEEKTEE